jgi:hypothetical protein
MMWPGTILPLLPSIFIEKNEIGGACSVYRGGEKLIQCFGGET